MLLYKSISGSGSAECAGCAYEANEAPDNFPKNLEKNGEIVGCFISAQCSFYWIGNGNRFMLTISKTHESVYIRST